MFKRNEHRGHVLFTIHSVTDIQVLPVPIQPKTYRFPNVHSALRSMNREGFSRRSSTVVPGFITMKPNKDFTLCLSTRELIKESCAAKI